MNDTDMPREFALVTACCRWPLSEAALATICGASTPAIDWSDFLEVVSRHRVAGSFTILY